MAGSKKAKPAAASSTSPPPAAAPAEASASASTAAASSSDAVANSASAPVAVAAPAVARPLQLPASYSADRGETTIRQLREEAQQLRRRVERVGQETPAERMRAKEIETELVQQRKEHRNS
jgi:hypothetical protein